MKLKLRHIAFQCLLLVLAARIAMAIQPTPLPDFELSTIDGQTVKSADLAGQGHWLLIYVQPNHHFSDRVLRLLKKQDYPQVAAHSIVIVGGSADDAKALKAAYPDLASAGWYADTSRSAFNQLHLHGIPVILGFDKKTMLWDLNGILPDLSTEKSIVNSWLGS